jgi:hypothetical protein
MILAAPSGPTGHVPGAAPVAAETRARVAVSHELRRAYRALGRAPVMRPEGRVSADPWPEGCESAAVALPDPDGPGQRTVLQATPCRRRDGPEGGFPVRLRAPGDTGSSLELAVLVSLAGPRDCDPSWSLDLLVDAGGRPFARLTLGLGPRGRSGTRELVVALDAPADLPTILHGTAEGGAWPLLAPGHVAGNRLLLDCLTADGRLAPRTTRWKDTT